MYSPNQTTKRVFTDDEYHDRFLPYPYLVPYAHALCSEPPSLVPHYFDALELCFRWQSE